MGIGHRAAGAADIVAADHKAADMGIGHRAAGAADIVAADHKAAVAAGRRAAVAVGTEAAAVAAALDTVGPQAVAAVPAGVVAGVLLHL